MGGHDRGDEITSNPRLLKASVSATVTSMAPCSVHIIKADDLHEHHGHRYAQSTKITLPGLFEAITNKFHK